MQNLFYHLGIKSEFSPLRGYGKIDEYVNKAVKLGHKVIGLSDINYMMGVFDFVNACNKNGIIPVPGVDLILSHSLEENEDYRIQLFAYNNKGFHNLVKLVSEAALLENLSKRDEPRATKELLQKYSEGVLAIEGGPESFLILKGADKETEDEVKNYIFSLKEIFDNKVIFELRLSNTRNMSKHRKIIEKFGREFGVPYFINANVHYAEQEDSVNQEIIMADSANAMLSETPSSVGGTRPVLDLKKGHYFSSLEEISEMEAVIGQDVKFTEKTLAILFRDLFSEEPITIEYDPDLRPAITCPDGMTELEYFDYLVEKGFKELRGDAPKEIQEESKRRIATEREVILSNDFISYFLVVRDFIFWSEDNGYPVGAGRGSAAGSEIGYLLRIHKADPIKYGLMFERFLSPGRGAIYKLTYADGSSEEVPVSNSWTVNGEHRYTYQLSPGDIPEESAKEIKGVNIIYSGSPPDIDTDLHTVGRGKVLEYVKEKYGEDSVANIVTFGTLKPKSAIKTLGRVKGIPISAVEHLSKMVMEFPKDYLEFMEVYREYKVIKDETDSLEDTPEGIPEELVIELNRVTKKVDKYKDIINFVENDKRFDGILEEVVPLLNLVDHTGVHASGVVVSGRPLEEAIPTFVRASDNATITQWNDKPVEAIGLIKMDFLGLDTVDLIDSTYKLVKERHPEIDFTMEEIFRGEMDDPEVFKLFQEGRTDGIFQFGEVGVTEMLMALKPNRFEDLAMTTAIYRPGPLGMGYDKEFVKRKNGEAELIPVHKDFYGTTLEDVIKNTYSIIIYQEQIMQIAARCADFTPYETDQLRKALGKKKVEILNSYEKQFKTNMLAKDEFKGMEDAVEILWDGILGFGSYAFNKSHSIAYAINSYQAAFLKAHYPLEFMTAALQQRLGDQEKRKILAQDAKRMGISVRNVSVNASGDKVSILPDDSIAFPLEAVKGLQKVAIKKIVERAPYKDLYDFLRKTADFMSESILKKLALSGALDDFNVSRAAIFKNADDLVKASRQKEEEPKFDLFSKFDSLAAQTDPLRAIDLNLPEFYEPLMLELEGNSTENYLFGTPMENIPEGKATADTFTGLLVNFKKRKSKKGNNLLELMILETGSDKLEKHTVFGNSGIFSQIGIKESKEEFPRGSMIFPLGNPYRLEKGKSYTFDFRSRNRYGEVSREITGINRLFFSNAGMTIKGWSQAEDYIATNPELTPGLSLKDALIETARKFAKSSRGKLIAIEYNNFVYLVPRMS